MEVQREVVEEISWCKRKIAVCQKMLVTFLLVERNLTGKYLLVDSKLSSSPDIQ